MLNVGFIVIHPTDQTRECWYIWLIDLEYSTSPLPPTLLQHLQTHTPPPNHANYTQSLYTWLIYQYIPLLYPILLRHLQTHTPPPNHTIILNIGTLRIFLEFSTPTQIKPPPLWGPSCTCCNNPILLTHSCKDISSLNTTTPIIQLTV